MVTKTKKRILLLIAIIIICISAFAIFIILSPQTKEEDITHYSYSMYADSDYKVRLKENQLYDDMFMEENMIYPKSIFDKLNINFHAEFSGPSNPKSDITADYKVEVKVRGFQIKGDVKKVIYEKTFPIFTQSGLRFSNKAYISEAISLDFSEYENYINNAELIIVADPSAEAELIFSGNFKAETQFGNKEEQFSYSIILPLFQSLFTIDKPTVIERTGSITDTQVTEIVAEKSLIFIPATVIFIMLLLILYIMFFTVLPNKEEIKALRFKSIMRKHGSRIVSVSESISMLYKTKLIIKDIESMIKISDQCSIPIFYIEGKDGIPEENSFFIPEKEICYIYYII